VKNTPAVELNHWGRIYTSLAFKWLRTLDMPIQIYVVFRDWNIRKYWKIIFTVGYNVKAVIKCPVTGNHLLWLISSIPVHFHLSIRFSRAFSRVSCSAFYAGLFLFVGTSKMHKFDKGTINNSTKYLPLLSSAGLCSLSILFLDHRLNVYNLHEICRLSSPVSFSNVQRCSNGTKWKLFNKHNH